jgi:membrane protein implicated in regulation of membrane protease activity
MDDPETWWWVWLLLALFFTVGEMATPGSFILLPFAVGAVVATGVALLGTSVTVELFAFVVTSVATLIALRPVARRLNLSAHDAGVGSRRLLGQEATVLADIPGTGDLGLGMVRINREEWRAESTDGRAIPSGVQVRVADVKGTRVVVAPLDSLSPGDEVRP